jgi:hypothetical protein
LSNLFEWQRMSFILQEIMVMLNLDQLTLYA